MLSHMIQTHHTLALIIAIAPIGAFDAIYYHVFKLKLAQRPEAWKETQTHILRSLLMGTALTFLALFQIHGAWFWFVGGIFVFDFVNNIIDVFLESESRRLLGGLPQAEYIVHMIGATGMGAVTASYFYEFWSHQFRATSLTFNFSHLSLPIQINALMIILGSFGLALLETVRMVASRHERRLSCCMKAAV